MGEDEVLVNSYVIFTIKTVSGYPFFLVVNSKLQRMLLCLLQRCTGS